MTRSFRLADFPALLLFMSRSPVNEARVRDNLSHEGQSTAVWPLLKGCLSLGGSRRSYVYTRRGLIQGLVCLRICRGPSTWEIEQLLFTPGNEGICQKLLERLSLAKDVRIFLRFDSGNAAIEMAKCAGFNHYLTEFMYCLGADRISGQQEPALTMIPRTSLADYKVFRLYNAAVPLQIRSVEGMTFQEWSQSREVASAKEVIFEKDGEVSAWVRFRFDGMAGLFDLLTAGGAAEIEQLVDYSLAALKDRHLVYCLVPEFQQQLCHILEGRGFHRVAEYSCFSKQLMARVQEPQLVPLRA